MVVDLMSMVPIDVRYSYYEWTRTLLVDKLMSYGVKSMRSEGVYVSPSARVRAS